MSFDFNRLPVVLQKTMTLYLPAESLAKACPVSKQFAKMVTESPAWKMEAEKLKLKNVTKENAKSKVAEHYANIELVRDIATYCIPLPNERKKPIGNDVTTFKNQIVERFQDDRRGIDHFSRRLNEVIPTITSCLHKNVRDFFIIEENVISSLLSAIPILRKQRGEEIVEQACNLLLYNTVRYETCYSVLLCLNMGIFDVASPDQFASCISRIMKISLAMNDHNPPMEGTVPLFQELLKRLNDHKTITKMEKTEVLSKVLTECADAESIPRKQFLTMLMEQGMAPPNEAVQKAIRFFICDNTAIAQSMKKSHQIPIQRPKHCTEHLETFLRYSPLQGVTLKHMVELVRQEKPDDISHHTNCYSALAVIEKITKEKASAAVKK